MSILSEELRAVTLKERYDERSSLYLTLETSLIPIPQLRSTKVRVSATFSATAFVLDEHLEEQPESGAIRDMRMRILESVFGEFRRPMYDIQNAIANRDWAEADELLRRLQAAMFEV